MKKILYKIIACLLIPSFVFAQPYPYQSDKLSVKQTDLSQLLKALDTEVGKEIITYVETTLGSIDIEHARAFTTANGEVAFVPIKSFQKILAALCYRQLEDGSEYLFLITCNISEKGVSFTFPSGQMYVMKSSGIQETINPDFQFQQNADLQNEVSINVINLTPILLLLCSPWLIVVIIIQSFLSHLHLGWLYMLLHNILISVPYFILIVAALYQEPNLVMIGILLAVYNPVCIFLIELGLGI